MPTVRPYTRKDWEAVLDLCLLAFAPACESLARRRGAALAWQATMERYLRSLTRPSGRRRFLVADVRGSVVGFVHYVVNLDDSISGCFAEDGRTRRGPAPARHSRHGRRPKTR